MAATWTEKTGSRKGNSTRIQRTYHGHDCTDEQDVADYVATLPATIAGLPYSDFDYEEREELDGAYVVTVTWGQKETSTQQNSAGEASYRFNYQAPSAQIRQSLSTINSYEDSTLLPFGPPDFGGAINVVNDGGKLRVEGFNVQPPPEVFTIPYTDVPAVITPTYQATVRGLCGKVNSVSYYGYAAGEIMLVRAQGEKKGGLWNLEFGFSYLPNETGLAMGDISSIAKDGHDLLWVFYAPASDATAKEVIKKPAAVYIERIFKRADLNDLNLP